MVGRDLGLGRRATIGEAKRALKSHAGPGPGAEEGALLASKLARLSRCRNSEVHDANSCLLVEIRNFLTSGDIMLPEAAGSDTDTLNGDMALQAEVHAEAVLADLRSQQWWAGPTTPVPVTATAGQAEFFSIAADEQDLALLHTVCEDIGVAISGDPAALVWDLLADSVVGSTSEQVFLVGGILSL